MRYNAPPQGTSDWHVPLNENFEDLDVEVIDEVATVDDLPTPTGETSSNGNHRRYLVHDERAVYVDTGSWEPLMASDGGTTGPIGGPFDACFHGSDSQDSPQGGLAEKIQNALANGKSKIDITGAWRLGGDITFKSGDFSPVGISIDADGAYVEYGGDGWTITNDQTGDAGSALRGGSFRLYGGFWESTGNPDGFIRMVDTGGCRIYPQQTRNFRANGKNSAIYQIEEGTRWCESNHFGGRHHLIDVGIRSVANRGTSFQDNSIDNIHLSNTKVCGFDLSGNWIDTTILNPTVIVSGNESAFLRMNGNMGGTEIIAPELESAASDLDGFYLVEVGPRAAKGPHLRGGDLGLNFDPITLFNLSNASSNWSFQMDYAQNHDSIRARFSDSGCVRRVMDDDGYHIEKTNNPNGGWERTQSF